MYERKNIGPTAILGWASLLKGALEGGGCNLAAREHAIRIAKAGGLVYYLKSGVNYSLARILFPKAGSFIKYEGKGEGIRLYSLYNSNNRAPALFNINNRRNQLRGGRQNRLVISWLKVKGIKQVYVHSLEGQALDLLKDIKEKTDIKVFVICHDHFYICPRVNLLYRGEMVCLNPGNKKNCKNCLPRSSFKNYEKTQAIIFSKSVILKKLLEKALAVKAVLKKRAHQRVENNFSSFPGININRLFLKGLNNAPGIKGFGTERRKYAIELLGGVDMVYAPSSFITQSLAACGLDKIETFRLDLPHLKSLQNAAQRKGEGSKTLRFCYRGSGQPQKGLAVFLEAIRLLPAETRRKCEFIVRGPGDISPFEKYEKEIPELKIYSSYTVAELETFIDEYDIGVLPHIWFENSPIVLLEHLASGKRVIAAGMGGVTDFIKEGENGWLFEPGNRSHLANIISSLVKGDI